MEDGFVSTWAKNVKRNTPPSEPDIEFVSDRLKEMRLATKGIGMLDTEHIRAGMELIIAELRELADYTEKQITTIREWEAQDHD